MTDLEAIVADVNEGRANDCRVALLGDDGRLEVRTVNAIGAEGPDAVFGQSRHHVVTIGGVFTYGDAGYVGSLGASPPTSPIIGIAPG